MAKRDRQYKWKEFYITSFDDIDQLVSAWYSSRDAFGPGRVFDANKGTGFIYTNLSIRDCRALFRHAGVRWYDYVRGIDDEQEYLEMTNQPGQEMPAPDDDAETCGVFDHEWGDHYYGYECTKCGMFIPFGSEPWMPIDDYEEDEYDYD